MTITAPAGSAASSTMPTTDRVSSLPRWFELCSLVPAILLTTVGGAALVLAMLGWYSFGAAVLLGSPLGAAGVLVAWRAAGRASMLVGRAEGRWAAATVVVAAASFAFSGWHPGQHVLVDRDPGSYGATARSIARGGSLRVDAAVGPFADAPNLVLDSAAVYEDDDGVLEFQFNHLPSAAMAMGYELGGQRVLFRLPALVGALALLPLYAFGRRLLGRPGLALAVPVAFATSLPFLSVTRDTYSEPFTLLLLFAGIVAVQATLADRTIPWAILAGGLVGGTMMTRIDGLAYLPPLAVVAAVLWVRQARWPAVALAGPAAVPAIIGTLDGRYLSGTYYGDLATQRHQLQFVLLAVSVVCVGAVLLRRPLGRLTRAVVRPVSATAAGILVTLAMLAGWLVRPAISTANGPPNSLIAGLQSAQGLTVDPTRNYAEQSLAWMAWYLGPVTILLAAIGAGLIVRRVLLTRDAAALVLVLFLAFGGVLYIWKPSISPDQIWAMRRYVPLVLPGLLLLAAATLGAATNSQLVGRLGRPVRTGLVAIGSAVLIVPPVLTVEPVPRLAEQAGYLDGIEAVCRRVGHDGVAVVAGRWAALTLPQSLRGWCGIPVAALRNGASGKDLPTLARAWAAECKTLFLVTANEPVIKPLQDVAPFEPVANLSNPYRMERVVERRPERYAGETVTLTASPVLGDVTCTAT